MKKKKQSRLSFLELLFCTIIGLSLAGTAHYVTKSFTQSGTSEQPKEHILPVLYTPIKTPHFTFGMEEQPTPVENMEVVVLTEDNSVTLDEVFSDQSVQKVMMEMQRLSQKLPKNKPIYLVMNTPGGSVDSGLRLISFAKALPQKVKTITIFAASMGFQTVQQLDERLMIENGTLMSHQASFGVQGYTRQVIARFKWIMSQIINLDIKAAERMKMSLPEYQELIRDEYWTYDRNSVVERAADRMVLAKCSDSLSHSKIKVVETIFGDFKVEVPACPLIPGYLSISSNSKNKSAMDYVKLMFSDRETFTHEYITTNKFQEFQK